MDTNTAPLVATGPTAVDPWAQQARITKQLSAWAVASIVGGGAAVAAGKARERSAAAGRARERSALCAFGAQNAAWGAIDLVIAQVGQRLQQRRMATLADPHAPEQLDRERNSLRRILKINAGLDVAYVAAGVGGLAWALNRDRSTGPAGEVGGQRQLPALAGHCAAVALQGAFLLAFDVTHARALA